MMNKRGMVMTALVMAFVLVGCVFVSIVRAEVTESIVVENGRLIVYKTEVITTKTKTIAEEYVMPTFAVSGQGVSISEIRDIMKRGAGEYEFGRTEKTEWEWGFPMRRKTYETRTVYVFENGNWSSKPIIRTSPIVMEESWGTTALLFVTIIGIFMITFHHLMSMRSCQTSKTSVIFYGIVLALTILITFLKLVAVIVAVLAFACGLSAIVSKKGEVIASKVFFTVSSFSFSALIFLFYGQHFEFAVFAALVLFGGYLLAKVAQITIWSEPTVPEDSTA